VNFVVETRETEAQFLSSSVLDGKSMTLFQQIFCCYCSSEGSGMVEKPFEVRVSFQMVEEPFKICALFYAHFVIWLPLFVAHFLALSKIQRIGPFFWPISYYLVVFCVLYFSLGMLLGSPSDFWFFIPCTVVPPFP
jgi:hypothetical protein